MKLLQVVPYKGSLATAVPTDPLIYRWYEIVNVYGTTIKELIHEEFGDGIMSAIDFSMDITREPDPKGDRVQRGAFRQVPAVQDVLGESRAAQRDAVRAMAPRLGEIAASEPADRVDGHRQSLHQHAEGVPARCRGAPGCEGVGFTGPATA